LGVGGVGTGGTDRKREEESPVWGKPGGPTNSHLTTPTPGEKKPVHEQLPLSQKKKRKERMIPEKGGSGGGEKISRTEPKKDHYSVKSRKPPYDLKRRRRESSIWPEKGGNGCV